MMTLREALVNKGNIKNASIKGYTLYLVWPHEFNTVDKIVYEIGKDSMMRNRAGQSLFVLQVKTVKDLLNKKIISFSDDSIYRLNEKYDEKQIKEIIENSLGHVELRNFLQSNDNTTEIFKKDQLK